jgi:alkylation response protein AidB-like acyl-CoA dehydrogenase
MGLDLDVVFQIATEFGRGCGSTAWTYSVWASHNWLVGAFPEQAQREYWANSANVLSSSSFNTSNSKLTATVGGYKLSGHWRFASGCDEASWVMLGGIGPEGLLYLLIPKSDYIIEDTWYVSGLRGTGSKDIVVEDAFIPEYRAVLETDIQDARSPGRSVHDTANYRVPMGSILPYTLASPIIGMAQGTIEEFENYTRQRVFARSGQKVGEFTTIHVRLAESEAEVRAAQLMMLKDCRELFELGHRGEMPAIDDRARYRRDQAYVVKLCIRAVNRLFEAGGGYALFDSSPLQRFHRDAHAASHHSSLSWDVAAEEYGQVRMGIQLPDSTMI